MSHAIDESNQRANMAYVGEKPWHGLGSELTPGSSIEIWCQQAGLNWKIDRAPVKFFHPDGYLNGFPERHVLSRSDNHYPLSVVGENYKIVQPGEIVEFYRDLVSSAEFTLETAGSLFGGRRIWALAKTGDVSRILGQDELRGYLLLATSCDGSLATTAKFTSVRVVCQNTLMASGVYGRGQEGAVKVPHSRVFNPEQVKAELGLVHNQWSAFTQVVETLASRKVTPKEAQQWLIKTFGDDTKSVEDQNEAAAKFMKKIWDCVTTSPGSNLRSTTGTAWGLVNGVTYYMDHVRRTRSSDARFNGAQFGSESEVKRRAMENAIALAA